MPPAGSEGCSVQKLRHCLFQEGGYRSWCEVWAEPQVAEEVAAAGLPSVNDSSPFQGSKMATRNAASVFACAAAKGKRAECEALQLG